MKGKQNIKDMPLSELPEFIKDLGLKSFAAGQIIQWIFKKDAASFDEMTNLSKEARYLLNKKYYVGRLQLVKTLESVDGTKKFAWRLHDGNIIESVLIPSESHSKVPFSEDLRTHALKRLRTTLCISTQVGCAMGCSFCRTGEMGFVRNLTQAEIIDQILEIQRLPCPLTLPLSPEGRGHGVRGAQVTSHESRVTNVVLMGMGEPLANYDNVLNAIKIMLDTKCLGLSKRHVTLSTCGLIPEIERLSKDNPGVKLAISLSATTDEQRAKLMPINKKYPLAKLFEALKKYSNATKRNLITFEYVMINGVNDSREDAKRLVKLLSQFPSKVNLIPLNTFHPLPHPPPSRGREGERGRLISPSEESIQQFAQYLRNKHIQVNIRTSRGQDILAACGQLAGRKS